ncbi:SpoIIE family protein phosphatase [Schlesneria sp.]|uniref:SpoIIE family protein phosphatase n=1 Tax=Schlesneria sp. TaxID=2762018 RepID=UPI002EF333ED
MAQLILLLDGEATTLELTSDETMLGRDPKCTLEIKSGMVSRRHARVLKQDGEYIVEDMGSGNGTYVNGNKLVGPKAIKHGDRIKLGPVLLRFENPSGASVSPLTGSARPANSRTPSAGAGNPSGTATTFTVELNDDDESSLMTGKASGFGKLDVKPEAKLKGVLEISRALAGTSDLDSLLPKILDTLFHIFPHADRGCILLRDDTQSKMIPRAMKHRRAGDDETVKLSRTILSKVLEEKSGILSSDATNDSRFEASESIANLTIRSMMCVPMLSLSGEPMGVINIDTQNPFNQFREEDLDLLMAVAGQAAMSYEQAKLLVTAIEKQKQDKEMDIAMGVQRSLLPTALPAADGWEFFASYDTAQAVGGDYYDAFFVEDGKKVCLAFGDVAGKGVPASLVMSRIATVVTNVMTFVGDVREAIHRINHQMCTRAVEGRFVTFVLCVIDLTSGEMTIAIAGHMPIMIRKTDGTIVEFGEEAIGVPLGVMEDFPYDVLTRTIEPGETCVIYTDGVSEAMNPENELYGVDRLRELMKASTGGHADALGKVILGDVRKFANGRPQNDDITIMVFGRR